MFDKSINKRVNSKLLKLGLCAFLCFREKQRQIVSF